VIFSSKYYDLVQLIERLHRRFLDVLKVELDKKGIQDINNVQAMILFNIGHDELTVGELTIRGYYLGSNVSYNIKNMVQNEYLIQERSVHDKRSIRVRCSDKGKDLYEVVKGMIQNHEETMKSTDIKEVDITDALDILKMLERFWAAKAQFAGMDDY
jgi:DNA-binding MarR family transcriptional regulator